MNDSEIVKALECCAGGPGENCLECPYDGDMYCDVRLASEALALVNRLEAEIERLNHCVKTEDEVRAIMKTQMSSVVREVTAEQFDTAMEVAKTATIREFAKRLKEDISSHRLEMSMNGLKGTPISHEITYECVEEYIDTLVKEMTEDES